MASEDDLSEPSRALETSNPELEAFASVVSHDLRSPLTSVIGNLELLESKVGGDLEPDARERLEAAIEGADRMEEMLGDLVEYARYGSDAGEVEPVDLGDVVADIRKDLSGPIEEADATIEVGELPTVEGRRTQLYDLLSNLVQNAVKFRGKEPPHIRIDAEQDGDTWTVRVADNGQGIASDQHEEIFEIFHRAVGEDVEGTGLGLALCKKIVTRHDGEIGVESTPGEGATFTFTLPAADVSDV